jgi:hypothetical protein
LKEHSAFSFKGWVVLQNTGKHYKASHARRQMVPWKYKLHTGCAKNTWRFLKWSNIFKAKWKNFIKTIRYIPCPWKFIWIITVWIWHFVGDHYVIQYTPAVVTERLS